MVSVTITGWCRICRRTGQCDHIQRDTVMTNTQRDDRIDLIAKTLTELVRKVYLLERKVNKRPAKKRRSAVIEGIWLLQAIEHIQQMLKFPFPSGTPARYPQEQAKLWLKKVRNSK